MRGLQRTVARRCTAAQELVAAGRGELVRTSWPWARLRVSEAEVSWSATEHVLAYSCSKCCPQGLQLYAMAHLELDVDGDVRVRERVEVDLAWTRT